MKTALTGERILGRTALGLILIVIILGGCTKTQQVLVREPATSPETLEGRWDLVSYGPVGSEAKVLTDRQVFIDFTGDGKISGYGGCNRYFGGWGFLQGTTDVIRIWRTGSTKMACDGPIMAQEYRYLEELSRVSTFTMEGKELRLYYGEGRGVLRFSRGANP
jgi:heat shock protein HslJ